MIATDPDRVPPPALPPLADTAIPGSLTGDAFDAVAAEGARTAPPRLARTAAIRTSKNLTKGSRICYPVFVDGANLSVGDLHFSQGDGENAIFMPGNTDPRYSEFIAFSGTSVTLDGVCPDCDSPIPRFPDCAGRHRTVPDRPGHRSAALGVLDPLPDR